MGHFYVNQSNPKGNFTTVKVGSASKLDFSVTPTVDLANATINMTMPLQLIYASGSTFFTGSLKANTQFNLTSYLFAMRETYTEIRVQTSGTFASSSTCPLCRIREEYALSVNTTLWMNVTQPDPTGPHPKNSTNIPPLNVTGTVPKLLALQSVRPESPGTTISGRFWYLDENSNLQPVRHARVQVWGDCFSFCFSGTELGEILTGNDGSFSWDYTGNSAIRPHFFVYTSANCCGVFNFAEVRPLFLDPYRAGLGCNEDGALCNVQPNSAPIALGDWSPQGDNSAWQIYDAIYSAFMRVSSAGFTPSWTQEVYWTVPLIPTPNTNIFVDASINMPSKGTYAWVHYHVQHEYGHAIMWHSMGGLGNFPCNFNCLRNHSLNSASDSGFAMSEGWAEFMQGWLDNNANDVTMNGCGGNVETGTFFSCGGGPNDGKIVEGSVAGVFWDMFDSGSGEPISLAGHDDLQIGHAFNLAPILGPGGIFPTSHPGDILQFFSLWMSRFPGDYSTMHTIYATYHVQNIPAPVPALDLTGVIVMGLLLVIIFALQRSRSLARQRSRRPVLPGV